MFISLGQYARAEALENCASQLPGSAFNAAVEALVDLQAKHGRFTVILDGKFIHDGLAQGDLHVMTSFGSFSHPALF